MVKGKGLLGLAGISLVISGCGVQAKTSSSAATVHKSPVFATVNGKALTQSQWQTAVDATSLLQGTNLPTTAQAKTAQMNALVQQSAVIQWGLSHHVMTKTAAATQAHALITSSLVTMLGGQSGLTKQLKAHHLTQTALQGFLTQQMILQAVFNKETATVKSVAKGAASKYYQTHLSTFTQPKQVLVREILLKTQAEAKKILAEVKKGVSFSQLAKKYSQDPGTKNRGGSLGYVAMGAKSGLVPHFYEEMDKLKPGQYGIAHTRFGFHVIEVQKIKPSAVQPYTAVRSQIISNLLQSQKNAAFQQFTNKVMKSAHIVKKFS